MEVNIQLVLICMQLVSFMIYLFIPHPYQHQETAISTECKALLGLVPPR